MSTCTTGIVGLGSMGLGMARNIIGSGLTAKGYDLSVAARDAFAAIGGKPQTSAAATSDNVDVLLMVLVNAEQIDQVLFGENGAVSTAMPGTVVMICSTVAPADVRRLASKLEPLGFPVLDAPVSGGRVGAESGSLTIMASGAPDILQKAKPVLDAISSKVYEVGDTPGLGATYKVVHQLAAGVHLAAAAEVMALGAHMGCNTTLLHDIVSKSSGSSWMFNDRVPRMLTGEEVPTSMVDIFVKDLGLVMDAGMDSKTPLPMAAAAHQLFLAASSMGHGKTDDSAVVRVYETATGVSVQARQASSRPAGRESVSMLRTQPRETSS